MDRKRLELVEQSRREGRLPAAARAVEQQAGLPRERAVEELERRRGERGGGGGAGQTVSVRNPALVRNRRRFAGASFKPPRAAAVELLEQLQAVVVVVVEVVEVEHHRGGRRLGRTGRTG